jgi:DNA-nicking Smr family endonuclease
MSIPRGLSAEEEAAWLRLAQSVTPLSGRVLPRLAQTTANAPAVTKPPPPKFAKPVPRPLPKAASAGKAVRPAPPPPSRPPFQAPPRRAFNSQLDSHWNRKLKAGQIAPDYTLDLHGHTLDTAYLRVTSGIDQARAMDARLVLVIAGRERPVDPADRAHTRGAIRAKLLDWLAASHHADAIAAVRRAHIRHGGEGALYLVLKRMR